MSLLNLKRKVARLADLIDGAAAGWGYPGDRYLGRQYFVNNVDSRANSTNSGRSWRAPFDEVDTAITAQAAYLATLSPSTNQYIRSQIFVQGTGTPYAPITSLPSHCDMIAIGAGPQGNGAGIARIGTDTGSGGGLTGTSAVRGLYMRGFQFQAGVSNYAFQLADIFRSTIEDCVFATNGSPGGPPTAYVEIDRAGGLVMRGCKTLNQSSIDADAVVGFDITGTHFHGSVMDDCFFSGADAAFRLAAVTVNGYHSIVKNSYFGWGSATCAIGVDDNATAGHTIFLNCGTFATANFQMANNGTNRIIGCYAANAFAT